MGAGGGREARPEEEEIRRIVKITPIQPPSTPVPGNPEYSDIRFGNGRFQLHCVIGRGGFGLVVAATDIATSTVYALKIENDSICTYKNELQVFKRLSDVDSNAAPHLFSQWKEHGYSVTQMELLGINLLDYVRQKKDFKISMSEACKLAQQMIDLIQKLHEVGIIHCDIKPANFVFGLGTNCTILKIIDFGLAMSWRDAEGEQYGFKYVPPKGTPAYMSVNQHLNYVNTRRDDMESMVFSLMDLCRMPMMWKSEHNLVREGDHCAYWQMKGGGTDGSKLCKDRRFRRALRMCRKMGGHQEPDYEAFRLLFKDDSVFGGKKKVQPKDPDAIIDLTLQRRDKALLKRFRVNKSRLTVHPDSIAAASFAVPEEFSDVEEE